MQLLVPERSVRLGLDWFVRRQAVVARASQRGVDGDVGNLAEHDARRDLEADSFGTSSGASMRQAEASWTRCPGPCTAFPFRDAVDWVREHYDQRAVETMSNTSSSKGLRNHCEVAADQGQTPKTSWHPLLLS